MKFGGESSGLGPGMSVRYGGDELSVRKAFEECYFRLKSKEKVGGVFSFEFGNCLYEGIPRTDRERCIRCSVIEATHYSCERGVVSRISLKTIRPEFAQGGPIWLSP